MKSMMYDKIVIQFRRGIGDFSTTYLVEYENCDLELNGDYLIVTTMGDNSEESFVHSIQEVISYKKLKNNVS